MRYNGKFYIQRIIPGGKNQYGEAMPPSVDWEPEALPCHIQTLTDNLRASYEDGTFRQMSFQILADPLDRFDFKRVRLIRNGEDLGEFDVKSVVPLTVQNRTQITV